MLFFAGLCPKAAQARVIFAASLTFLLTIKTTIMPRYRLTIKKTGKWNGVYTEKGMSVEVAYQNSIGPLSNAQNKQEVINAFRRVYGIDMSKQPNMLNPSFMDVKKL